MRISDPRDILRAPVISEKSYALLDENKYTFIVSPDANKTQIKIAVEQVFGVKVTSVNTLNRQGMSCVRATGPASGPTPSERSSALPTATASTSSVVRSPDRPLTTRKRNPMGIRKYKPTTPGRRGSSVADFVELTRSTPEKSLVRPLPRKGGRNNQGRITTRHQGGGHKRAYRVIDFRRADKDGVPAKVAHIEYDPNRTARIALLHYADGEKRYIVAPNKLKQGDAIETGPSADIKPGNNLPLRNIPVGTVIHAVELRPGGGAKIARSAGVSIQLVAKDGPYAQLRLPSGEIRNIDVRCRATIGEVGNAEQSNINWGKAGRMRWKGKRPTVRGVAMNPVDHPHGGGEGKTSGGRHPVNPNGKPEGRTRKANKASDKFIVRRRKTGKKR